MNTFFHKHQHTGFTLIETLVAIFIFSSALVALSGVASRGVNSVNRIKEVVTAEFLAQEGLEIVRYVRDNGTLANVSPWDAGFAGSPNCLSGNCDIFYPAGIPELQQCPSQQCAPLVLQNGIYRQAGGMLAGLSPTDFTRSIRVRPLANDTAGNPIEYLVSATVSWPVGTSSRSVTISTTLTDWQTPLSY